MEKIIKYLENFAISQDGIYNHAEISFDHFEKHFTTTNKMLSLFSKIEYKSDTFSWQGIVETAQIPYYDKSIGFLIDGSNLSSIGVYQRAPGPVLESKSERKGDLIEERNLLNIITLNNKKLIITFKRNAMSIVLPSGNSVPMGIFLKAISGMPYFAIKNSIAYKSKELIDSFLPIIPKNNIDLSKLATNKDLRGLEPSLEECISEVYSKLISKKRKENIDENSVNLHYKNNVVKNFLTRIQFKRKETIESKLSVNARVIGTYLAENINLPIFTSKGDITYFKVDKDTFIDAELAKEIKKYDINKLIVKTSRVFTIQDCAPMYFRIKGYKLAMSIEGFEDIFYQGLYIDDDILEKLNNSNILNVEVFTPNERKTVLRYDETTNVHDFYTLINYFLTNKFLDSNLSTQYAIDNRVIMTYNDKVINTIKDLYLDICNNIIPPDKNSESLSYIFKQLSNLPSTELKFDLINSNSKERSQPDLTNLLSRLINANKSSALMKSSPIEMTVVQQGQYGRLDSLHVPESDKIGSVQQCTVLSQLKEGTGEITTPYIQVVDGEESDNIEYLTANEEKNKYIASWNEDLSQPYVSARINGNILIVSKQNISYKEVSPFIDMSLSRSLIPFQEYTQPKRLSMATKQQGQAIPLLLPERPLVSTGMETEIPCLYYTVKDILDINDIEAKQNIHLQILKTSWTDTSQIYTFTYDGNIFSYSIPVTMSDKKTLYMYKLNVKEGYKYNIDDILFFYFSTDLKEYEIWSKINQGKIPLINNPKNPSLSLGKNVRVGFKTAQSSTIEDGIVISDRLVSDNVFTSLQIFKYDYELKNGEKFANFDSAQKIHSWVYSGQPIITIVKPNGKYKSVNAFITGEITFKKVDEYRTVVYVVSYHTACLGDKIAGRFGNKSVITKIIPEYMMPYDPITGETLDICLNPLGIPSRMNFGQILEVALGAVMNKQNKIAVITPFYPNIKELIIEEYNKAGLSPKKLYNPMYGKYTEKPIMTGFMYILKLEQISNLKISAVGYPISVDPVFNQPSESISENKGQKIGEMETWALAACNMFKTLDDFFSWYSTNEPLRRKYFTILSEDMQAPWSESKEYLKVSCSSNRNGLFLQTVLRNYCLDIIVEDNHYRILPLDTNKIVRVVNKNTIITESNIEWSKFKLQQKIISPFWIKKFDFSKILNVSSIDKIIIGSLGIDITSLKEVDMRFLADDEKNNYLVGISAIVFLLENTDINTAIERLSNDYTTVVVKTDDSNNSFEENINIEDTISDEITNIINDNCVEISLKQMYDFLVYLRDNGYNLNIFVLDYFPVMPSIYRQSTFLKNGDERIHSFNKHYQRILSAVSSKDIYEAVSVFIGYKTLAQNDLISLQTYFLGKNAGKGHSKFRDVKYSTRVGFSGRAVIIPAEDITMSPFFIGIPWYMALRIYNKHLTMKLSYALSDIAVEMHKKHNFIHNHRIEKLDTDTLSNLIKSLWEFNFIVINKILCSDSNTCIAFYNILRKYIKYFIEGSVNKDGTIRISDKNLTPDMLSESDNIDTCIVLSGRQPTLHKKSIRGFFVKLVDGWCIQIHPLVCKAYNADFDGDTMWAAGIFGESMLEALKNIFVDNDLISDKDGEFTLGLSQDICLGLYCMTVFKGNKSIFSSDSELYYYSDVNELRADLEFGTLHYWDTIIFEAKATKYIYLSTAGRILINNYIPGGLTDIPFTDKYKIAEIKGIIPTDEFKELLFDTIFASTKECIKGASNIKISDVLKHTYNNISARDTVMVCQNLYEIGLVASDIFGISMSLDDMSISTDFTDIMNKPSEKANHINSLYQLGLITLEKKKAMEQLAWKTAKDEAQTKLVEAIPEDSNTSYILYSGARSKPDQIMQALGFIGSIKKTEKEDISMPILKGYCNGLTSFDLFQTTYSARIGIVSTQAETKNSGYATRQSVYMKMGLKIKEIDCGIHNSLYKVSYARGKNFPHITDKCKKELLSMKSYALPYLNENKMITNDTLTFIEKYHLTEVIALDSSTELENLPEAYLPVEYDSSKYKLYKHVLINNKIEEKEVSENSIYMWEVSTDSPNIKYYINLLDDNKHLTIGGFEYLLSKKIKEIHFKDKGVVYIKYSLSNVFKELILNRIVYALPYLSKNNTITDNTIKVIEDVQLENIAIRTSLTCHTVEGICAMCYGYKNNSNKLIPVGESIGIIAAQSMCETISQSTLDVTHSGGKRSGNLVSGLDYFRKLLKGSLVPKDALSLLEIYAPFDAFIVQDKFNKDCLRLSTEEGKIVKSFNIDSNRIIVPNNAYVDKNDTIISGMTNLNKFSSTQVFSSALKTRYLLILEYAKVFMGNGLNVAPRNYEILARAQTSLVYLCKNDNLPLYKDTSIEILEPTGKYELRVSSQENTVWKYTGIGALGFEQVENMITHGILNPSELKLNSFVANFATDTPVNSNKAEFPISTSINYSNKHQRKQIIYNQQINYDSSDSLFADLYDKKFSDTQENNTNSYTLSTSSDANKQIKSKTNSFKNLNLE